MTTFTEDELKTLVWDFNRGCDDGRREFLEFCGIDDTDRPIKPDVLDGEYIVEIRVTVEGDLWRRHYGYRDSYVSPQAILGVLRNNGFEPAKTDDGSGDGTSVNDWTIEKVVEEDTEYIPDPAKVSL